METIGKQECVRNKNATVLGMMDHKGGVKDVCHRSRVSLQPERYVPGCVPCAIFARQHGRNAEEHTVHPKAGVRLVQ